MIPVPQTITYEWIVTLSWNARPTVTNQQTRIGTITVPIRQSRSEIRTEVIRMAATDLSLPLDRPATVMFMDFTPVDQLVHLQGFGGSEL